MKVTDFFASFFCNSGVHACAVCLAFHRLSVNKRVYLFLEHKISNGGFGFCSKLQCK